MMGTIYEAIMKLNFMNHQIFTSSRQVSCQKDVLSNFAKFTGKKHLCQSLFLNKVQASGIAQVFSYEFCEISKNAFSYRTPPVAASEL